MESSLRAQTIVLVTLIGASAASAEVVLHPGYAVTAVNYWTDSRAGFPLDVHKESRLITEGDYFLNTHSEDHFIAPEAQAPEVSTINGVAESAGNVWTEVDPRSGGTSLYLWGSAAGDINLITWNSIHGLHARTRTTYEVPFTLTAPERVQILGHFDLVDPGVGQFTTGQILLLGKYNDVWFSLTDPDSYADVVLDLPAGDYWFRTELNVELAETPDAFLQSASADLEAIISITPEPAVGLLMALALLANRGISRRKPRAR